MSESVKTLGQTAYERDLAKTPTYQDGGIRPTWAKLSEIARWSWERNPTDRECNCPMQWHYYNGNRCAEQV